MNMKWLVAILITLATIVSGYTAFAHLSVVKTDTKLAVSTTSTPVSKYDVGPPDAEEMLELVNQERSKYGVAPLVVDQRLVNSAMIKAKDMNENNYFDHVDANGKHGYEYAHEAMPECFNVGENIVMTHEGIGATRDKFNWWVNSKPHHDAMIDPKNTLTGIAVSGYKVVEHFCSFN